MNRFCTAALSCLLLAGCQVTTFEKAPLPALAGCDPALVGSWLSIDDDGNPTDDGEMTLHIDADCGLRMDERRNDGVRRIESTPLRLARHGDHAYGWVDADWGLEAGNEEHTFPAGDVILMRYRIDGDSLQVWSTDDKAIAHAIIDGELTGAVDASDTSVYNRLTGEQDPAVLDRAAFFDAEPAAFRRASGD